MIAHRWVSDAKLDEAVVVTGGTGVMLVEVEATLAESLVLGCQFVRLVSQLRIYSRSLRI